MQSAVYSHRSRLIPCITMKQTDPGMVYTPFRDPFCISVENRPFAPCFIPSPFLLSLLASPLQRQQSQTLPLAQERAQVTLASYQTGRADLGAVLAARKNAIEAQLRALDLQSQVSAQQARLSHLIAE